MGVPGHLVVEVQKCWPHQPDSKVWVANPWATLPSREPRLGVCQLVGLAKILMPSQVGRVKRNPSQSAALTRFPVSNQLTNRKWEDPRAWWGEGAEQAWLVMMECPPLFRGRPDVGFMPSGSIVCPQPSDRIIGLFGTCPLKHPPQSPGHLTHRMQP